MQSLLETSSESLSRGFARSGAKPVKLNSKAAATSDVETKSEPKESKPLAEEPAQQNHEVSKDTVNRGDIPESEVQLKKLKKKSGNESSTYEAHLQAERESNLRVAKDRYMNKTRQLKYNNKEEVRYETTPTQIQLQKNIKKTKSVNGVLNTFERDRFYLSTDLLLSTCAQFLKVQKSFRKLKKINQIDAMKKGLPKLLRVPKATADNDKRVQALVSTIQRSVSEMTPAELVKAAWVLTKGNYFLQAEDVVFKIQKKLADMPMDQFTPKELSLLMWTAASEGTKNKMLAAKAAVEFGRRFKILQELRGPVFAKKLPAGGDQSENQDTSSSSESGSETSSSESEKEIEDYLEEDEQFQTNEIELLPPRIVSMYFWSLSSLRIKDDTTTAEIMHKLLEEKVVDELGSLEISMLIPTIKDNGFAQRQQMVEAIYTRLETLLQANNEYNKIIEERGTQVKALKRQIANIEREYLKKTQTAAEKEAQAKNPKKKPSVKLTQDLQTKVDNLQQQILAIKRLPDPPRNDLKNALTVKNILWNFYGLNSVLPNASLFHRLAFVYLQRQHSPSPHFFVQVLWAMSKCRFGVPVPPALGKQVERVLELTVNRMSPLDLSQCLHALGKISAEQSKSGADDPQSDGDSKQNHKKTVGLDMTYIVKLLATRAIVKRDSFDSKSKDMIKQYTAELGKYSALVKQII